jgi:PAS domain S-box-containing protein
MRIAEQDMETGSLRALVAGFDWAATALGPRAQWPGFRQAIVRMLLASPLAIVTLWGPDGILIYNDAYARFAGARHPRLLGAKVLEGWPEAADLNRRVLQLGLAGRTLSLRDERLVLRRYGFAEELWLDLDYSPITDDAGQPVAVLAVVTETTQRVRLERARAADITALNESAARHRCLVELGDRLRALESTDEIANAAAEILCRCLDGSRAGYAVIDEDGYANVANDWTNGRVRSLAGRHLFSALGEPFIAPLRRGEAIAVADVLDHPMTADNPQAWLSLGTRAVMNVPLLENNNVAALMYVHDETARAWKPSEIMLMRDVADRTWEAMGRARATEGLRRLNESLAGRLRERTAERDRMWLLSTDLMLVAAFDSTIQAVNPAWRNLLGWREDELIGHSLREFIHPDDVEGALGRLALHATKLSEPKALCRYRKKDGDYLWFAWTATPDEQFVHAVGRDVTAEKYQAEALRAAEEALRQAQKMEAVGQLTGGIAHDFNNILQGIAGSLDLVKKRIQQGRMDEIAGHADSAMASASRAAALTHRLLAFSRRQPLDPKPVDANPLILAMRDLLARTLGAQIELVLELAEPLWVTLCDPNQLDSAVLNLAINARDAMPDGGRLVIATANVSLDEGLAARTGTIPAGDYVCITVADTGTGMSPDVIRRAFDPFYTTKPIGQGTGLGLSMVYGFMLQSGGHADIESTPGQGTTVRLYLPRGDGVAAADAADAPAVGDLAVAGGKVVLVLEDEPVVRSIVVEVLQELGLQAIEAANGVEGLDILRSRRQVDLLVTDIGLPGLNGRQVAEAARLEKPNLKILFMTGYAETVSVADGFLAPGMEMITKPFAIDSLALRIKSLIETL